MHRSSSPIPSIAVVGVSAIFPGSLDAHGFWRDILAGTDLITDVPETHWLIEDYYDPDPSAPDKTYAKRGAFLKNVPFDPLEWGVPPSIVPATDTTQLLSLIVAKRVLEDAAQGQFESMDRERMSVILGVTSAQELLASMVSRIQRPVWSRALRELGYPEEEVKRACDAISGKYVPWQESSFPGLLGNVVAGRIANRLDLGGTNCVTDAACASSLSAMSMAINELALGQSDLVIAGGCDTMNDAFMYMCFSKTPALSRSGDCRPFSDKADGTLLGEGIGMVALKRLDDAERDGDRVYAVIRGIGSSSDGRSKSVYAPVPEGQAKALRRTYAAAGYGPDTVELMEAHGTGTKAGDAAEFEGLRAMFDESGRADRQWCALGSVKSQIGHTKAAAGAAGLFKAVMALHHKVLPPTIKVDKPNPKLEIEKTPFYLNTEARPWIRASDHPRRASVSSFGFGGSNFHVALEEYTGPAPRAWRVRALPAELVLLSADTPAALADRARALAKAAETPEILRFLARESVLSFDASRPARLGLCATDEADLARKLEQVAAHLGAKPEQALAAPLVHCASGEAPGQVAFLFPGQGSQYVAMGADALMTFDAARAAWDAAAGVAIGDAPLQEVVFPRPVFSDEDRRAQEARLRETRWAQPAIGATSLSHLALLGALGVRADAFAGHSFGEITALHAAGALSAADLLRVARRRGELMGEASSERGAMIAVPRSIDEVRALGLGDVVVANHNGPKQVVLSGSVAAIEAAEERLRGLGIQARRLDVAAAFHSPLVSEASAPFREFLGGIAVEAPGAPVYSNAEVEPYPGGGDAARDRLARQLAEPVRFVEQIERMYAAGVRTFVEVGPGSVLTNLVGDILSGRPHRAVALDRKGKHGVTSLFEAVARLAVAGVPLDARVLWDGFAAPVDPRALPKPKLALPINGSNYGKPYPPQGGAKELPKASAARPAQKPAPEAARAAGAAVGGAARPVVSAAAPVVSAARPVVSAARPVVSAARPVVSAARPVVSAAAPVVSATRPTVSASQPTVSASQLTVSASQLTVSAPPPAVSASQPAVSARAPAASASWLAAYQEAQRATAEAHGVYQRTMAESHIAFLQAAEASFAGLAALATGAPYTVAAATAPEVRPAPVLLAPVHAAAPAAPAVTAKATVVAPEAAARAAVVAPAPAVVAPAPAAASPAPAAAAPVRVAAAPAVAAKAAVAPPAAVTQAAAAAAPGVDLERMVLDVVADKTGYPVSMLGLQMELESDLGIDSIKRVEILSSVRDRTPGLSEVDASALAQLRTLGQVVDHLRASLPAGAPAAAARPAAAAPVGVTAPIAAPAAAASVASAAAPAASAEVERVVMSVVAETTGYPAEMLGLQMELESDLGIDSIKRVEILSAVRDRTPGLSEVDASALAQLRTLGQVVDHLRASLPAAAPAAASVAPAAAPVASAEVERVVMAVVAETTGYPAEMLGLQMELESDLGIDSIKRVEILSAVRDRTPGLSEVDASALAQLRTLGQVVDHLRASLPAGAPAASAVASPTAAAAATSPAAAPAAASVAPAAAPVASAEVERVVMAVVAETTGYPAEMLGLQMELESDLGIDSIKRVEILSAVRDRTPGLSEVDASALAQLRTLGQVVDHLRANLGPAGSATPAKPAEEAEEAASAGLGRWTLAEVPAPAAGLAMPGLFDAGTVVVTGHDAIGPALAAALEARGIAAEYAPAVPRGARGAVFLGGLRDFATVDEALAVHREAFLAAQAIAAKPALFVTVQDTGGDFGLAGSDRAWAGGLPGLAKTAALEWAEASCRAIDVERGGRTAGEIAEAIATELLSGGVEREIGLRADGQRTTLLSVRQDPQPGPLPLGPSDVVVASGGARGVTAATLIALARASRARFALLGRTALEDDPAACRGADGEAALKAALIKAAAAAGQKATPADIGRQVAKVLANREVRATLDAIRAAGGDALYVSADVNDARAVAAALDGVRSALGPITAVVHGAGVLADKLIAEKTVEQLDRVFNTKVDGLRALLGATASDPLKAIVLFSSIAARSGNKGQCDYAMANEVLNKVAAAEAARRPGCRVKSLGWGPWQGGMVNAALEAHFAQLGVPLIPLAAGARMLIDELCDGPADSGAGAPGAASPGAVEVVLGAEPKTLAAPDAADHGRRVALAVRADRATHPYLGDHAINGVPVVPVVIALEWFARAARACRPDLVVTQFRDVRVLRGIKLAAYESGGEVFRVDCREVSNGHGAVLAAELRGPQGALHYAATIEMKPLAERVAPRGPTAPSLGPWSGGDDLYDGHTLFHGRDFQVIRQLDGVSREGIAGTVVGLREAGWVTQPWKTDPAALDGGLQLATLWTQHVLGGAALPMSVGALHTFAEGPSDGPLRAVVRGQIMGRDRTKADIAFVDDEGTLVAELRDVQYVLRPDAARGQA
ncbi:SDR family NAD(P)-dependent oxidoreductase [Sorangium sp. So ce1153]|uniref:SDR family NAD(P)-dependent oxidoreductase n=1 Tax=Sorangium sp. So ce1153 TaxID=3133333 RepID=UPI003F625A64